MNMINLKDDNCVNSIAYEVDNNYIHSRERKLKIAFLFWTLSVCLDIFCIAMSCTRFSEIGEINLTLILLGTILLIIFFIFIQSYYKYIKEKCCVILKLLYISKRVEHSHANGVPHDRYLVTAKDANTGHLFEFKCDPVLYNTLNDCGEPFNCITLVLKSAINLNP